MHFLENTIGFSQWQTSRQLDHKFYKWTENELILTHVLFTYTTREKWKKVIKNIDKFVNINLFTNITFLSTYLYDVGSLWCHQMAYLFGFIQKHLQATEIMLE